jgi:hypothetical protein
LTAKHTRNGVFDALPMTELHIMFLTVIWTVIKVSIGSFTNIYQSLQQNTLGDESF